MSPESPTAAADSVRTAPADSLDSAAWPNRRSVPLDSLGVGAGPDSLRARADADSLGGRAPAADEDPEIFELVEREQRLRASNPPIVRHPVLDWRRAETVAGLVEVLPTASLRVAGDKGMQSYLSVSPTGTHAPELWSDGIPTRSPGDLDPGVWDRSSIAIDAVGSSADGAGPHTGEPEIRMSRRAARPGRTLMVTRFSNAAFETFQRAVSVTTPASNRVVRLEFEDWATDEGYEYSRAAAVTSNGSRGRSAMRRFRLGTDFQIDEARVRFTFGRGRRFHRGDALGVESTERWTGEAGVVVDHFTADAITSVSAWHLDFHDDENAFDQEIDAARQGLRVQRRPDGAGWGFDARVERWSMQTEVPDTLVRVDPVRVLRAAAFIQGDPLARLWPWFRAEVVDGENTSRELGLGGRAGLRLRTGFLSTSLHVTRDLRVPTLLESDGWKRMRTVTPSGSGIAYTARNLTWQGERRLDVEVEERVGVEVEARGETSRVHAAVEQWRLRDGIGWTRDEEIAQVVGDLEVDALMVHGGFESTHRFGAPSTDWRLRVLAQGQFLPSEIAVDASRGVGFPRWQSRARIGLDRTFFSVRNRIGLDLELYGRGPARDDGLGPQGSVEIPTSWDVGTRAWLRVRDAEMSINFDNVLDRTIEEVAGTTQRVRQLRWQLVWPFFN